MKNLPDERAPGFTTLGERIKAAAAEARRARAEYAKYLNGLSEAEYEAELERVARQAIKDMGTEVARSLGRPRRKGG